MDNLVVLNSHQRISKNFKLDVKESFSRSSDSIYFDINNSLEGVYDYRDKFLPLYYYYSLELLPRENYPFFEETLRSNHFNFQNKAPIDAFVIRMMPNLFTYPMEIESTCLYSVVYSVNSTNSNTFKINIQNFDFMYFYFKSFVDEYVRIIDDRTLMCHNEKFLLE